MVEENQKFSLEDYLKDLGPVYQSAGAQELTEQYNLQKNRPGSDVRKILSDLGKLVTGDEETYLFESDSGTLTLVDAFQESIKPNVESTIEKYKPRILEDYVEILSQRIKELRKGLVEANEKAIAEKIEKGELKEDTRKDPEYKDKLRELIDLDIQEHIGDTLYRLPVSDSYKEVNQEVYGIVQQIKALEELSEDGTRREELKSAMVNARGLPEIYARARIADKWASKENVNKQISLLKRTLGACFIGKNGQIKKGELNAYTKDNIDSYRRMGGMVYGDLASKEASKK